MKKNILRYGLILILTAVLLFFFFRSVDWDSFFASVTNVNVFFFALMVVLGPFHIIPRALRWRYLILPEKKDVKFYNLVAGQAIGFTVTLILPGRLGEIVKPLYLARKEKISEGFALGTVVVERIFDIIAMVFLLAAFLLARPLYVSQFSVSVEAYSWLFKLGMLGLALDIVIIGFVLCLHFFREATLRILNAVLKPFPAKFSSKVRSLIEEFLQGLRFFRSFFDLARFFLLSLLVWASMVVYYWFFFLAYREVLPVYTVIPYVFATMIGAAIPTPGMAGGFDFFSKKAIMSLYFSPRIPADAPSAVRLAMERDLSTKATAMTLAVHAIQVVMTCLVGFVILWKEGLSLLKLKKMGEEFQE
ncbi:MAG: flippase-like domain-containing protein [Candidatus Aminicenantes bacterium]|nr:flippase-like domain-containing protein [Candidatus Aminicenantes bacterium]